MEKINRKIERGEALTDKQTAFAETYRSESVSIMAELALGNEHFARRLLDANASIVEKLLNRIAEVKEALARRKDPEAKAAFAEIRKAEEMFLDALAEKGMRFEGGRIIGSADEEDENSVRDDVDKGADSLYNIKQSKKYKYTKEQYTKWAWVRANDLLTRQQMDDFWDKWTSTKRGVRFVKNKNNEYIIPVCNLTWDEYGVDNHLVYAKRLKDNPVITKVVKIQLENETEIDIVRRDILRNEEQYNDEALELVKDYYGEELICIFSQQDMPSYREYSEGEGGQGSGASGGTDNGYNRKSPDGRGDADGDSESRGSGNGVKKSRKANSQASGKTIGKPVDNLPTEANPKGRVRELTAAELERELNEAGLLLTSKDNNKNNLRIGRYISDHYPELSGRVKFFNNKATGRVTVQKIETEIPKITVIIPDNSSKPISRSFPDF